MLTLKGKHKCNLQCKINLAIFVPNSPERPERRFLPHYPKPLFKQWNTFFKPKLMQSPCEILTYEELLWLNRKLSYLTALEPLRLS